MPAGDRESSRLAHPPGCPYHEGMSKQTALITGASQRLGQAMCMALGVAGYDVALHYHRTDPAETVAMLTDRGVDCKTYQADLSDLRQAESLMASVSQDRPPALLINNASSFLPGTIQETGREDWSRHFNINLAAPFFLSQAFARHCRQGCIINMLDAKITGHGDTHAAYLMTKKALSDFTAMAALAFAPNIRVNGIAPGPILPPADRDSAYLSARAAELPLQRQGNTNDITRTLSFLLNNAFITGQVIFVDGGDHLCT